MGQIKIYNRLIDSTGCSSGRCEFGNDGKASAKKTWPVLGIVKTTCHYTEFTHGTLRIELSILAVALEFQHLPH